MGKLCKGQPAVSSVDDDGKHDLTPGFVADDTPKSFKRLMYTVARPQKKKKKDASSKWSSEGGALGMTEPLEWNAESLIT
jgi:hypothetical protein